MKNKAVAFALALVGGIVGLHRFYLNNTKKGLIYLFLSGSGISRFLSLADMIMIMSSEKDEFDSYLVTNNEGRRSLRNTLFRVEPIVDDYVAINNCNSCGANDFYNSQCNYCGKLS